MTSTYKETETLAGKITKAAGVQQIKNILSSIGGGVGRGLTTLSNEAFKSIGGGFGKHLTDNINMKFFAPKPAFGETVSKVLQTAGVGLGIGGGIVGIAALIEKYNLRKKEMASPMFFQEMLLKNGDVNDYYLSGSEGKTRVEDLFKLLEHFAPKIAENALATGTFIRQYMKYGELGANMDIIAALAKINKDSQDGNSGLAGTAMGKLFDQSVTAPFKYDPTYRFVNG